MIEKKIVILRKDLLRVEEEDEICCVFAAICCVFALFAEICCVFALFAASSGEIC